MQTKVEKDKGNTKYLRKLVKQKSNRKKINET